MSTNIIGNIENFVIGEDFEAYIERLEQLFELNTITEDKKKVALFISLVGSETYKILKSIVVPKSPTSMKYEEIIESLKRNFAPKKNIVAERFKFYKRKQRENETIAEYVVELKYLAQSCGFNTFLNEALRDRLICGLRDDRIRAKLLSSEPSFDEAQATAMAMEMAEENVGMMRPSNNTNWISNYDSKSFKRRSKSRGRQRSAPRNRKGEHRSPSASAGKLIQCFKCKRWGRHVAAECTRDINKYQEKSANRYKKQHKSNVNSVEYGIGPIEANSEISKLSNLKLGSLGLFENNNPVYMNVFI